VMVAWRSFSTPASPIRSRAEISGHHRHQRGHLVPSRLPSGFDRPIARSRRPPAAPGLSKNVNRTARQRADPAEGSGSGEPDLLTISIPPKYAVSQVSGIIKGKSAIHLARVYGERKRNFVGQNFWARGYFVSTVGRDEEVVREYIRKQEKEDERFEQLSLFR